MNTDNEKPPEFVADEPELAAPLGGLTELFDPASVPAGSLERLMLEVAEPPLRYAPFFDRLAELWDLSEPDVRAVLERTRDKRAWRRAPLPGLELMRVEGGPRLRGTESVLARFAPGMTFPPHGHRGHEDVLILEGSYTDNHGKLFRSGDVHSMEAGGEHSFTIGKDEPCIAAAVHRGIRFRSLGMRVLAKLFGA
ncbi:MAG TPA: cupin domain-containing protein [Polyangiaceae bacterium]|nr:cupin domain-containing protein [Polyangiaceae bacterium]